MNDHVRERFSKSVVDVARDKPLCRGNEYRVVWAEMMGYEIISDSLSMFNIAQA